MNSFSNNPLRPLFAGERSSIAGCKAQFSNLSLFGHAGSSTMPLAGLKRSGIAPANVAPATIAPANVAPSIDYIYVNGSVRAVFNTKGLKKEFERRLLCRGEDGKNKQYMPENHRDVLKEMNLDENYDQLLYEVLAKPENNYIARDMTWTLVDAFGNDVYTLIAPQTHLKALIAAIKPRTTKLPHSVMLLGSASVNPPGVDTGAGPDSALPNLTIKKVEKTNPTAIIKAITATDAAINVDKLKEVVAEILSLGENDGDTDKERALNYILYHNFAIYTRAYKIMYESDGKPVEAAAARLSSVQVLPQMSGERLIAKVVFDFQNTTGGIGQSWYCAVDVTDDYPFLLVPFRRFLQSY